MFRHFDFAAVRTKPVLSSSKGSELVKKNHFLWFSSIASPAQARTRSRESSIYVLDSRPAIGQLLLRCLNSGIHAVAMAELRG